MEASVKATPAAPEGKPPQVLDLLRSLLDTLLVPFLAVVTALILGGLLIIATDASVYRAFDEGGLGAGLGAAWRSADFNLKTIKKTKNF